MHVFNWLVFACWLVFLGYWIISAFGVKKKIERESRKAAFIAFVVALVVGVIGGKYLRGTFFPVTIPVGIIAVLFSASGIAFAIWARVHLGKNWSPVPSIQAEHELVTSGPYRFVRHPIYTGVLLALLGSVLVSGKIWLISFFVGLFILIRRIKTEEGYMMRLFPSKYPEYKKRTKALIPFVW